MNYKLYDEGCRLSDKMLGNIKRATETALEFELGESYNAELPVEVSISVVDAGEMREINAGFRGIDSVTDVLSFPQYFGIDDILEEIELNEEGREMLLGDVVLCYDRMLEQAEEYGTSEEREVVYLYVHSIMHLLGYDHMTEEDRAEMREHEERVMTALGIQ